MCLLTCAAPGWERGAEGGAEVGAWLKDDEDGWELSPGHGGTNPLETESRASQDWRSKTLMPR